MCMLTVYPMPDLLDDKGIERISNGAQINGDGHGWAVVVGGQILTGKSMDAGLAIEGFARAYTRATGPALFHSRWATHGTTNLANVHPFPVKKIRDTYVAHNGIMPAESHPEKWDARSDTRIFADDILPQRFRHLDSSLTRDRLQKWLSGNKIAVLTTNKKYVRQLYVFGQERGTWADGVWYSNDDFEGRTYRWLDNYRQLAHEWADELCHYCDSMTINEYAYCTRCGTCQDCFEPERECMCWSGSSSTVIDTVKPGVWTPDTVELPGDQSEAEQAAYVDWLRSNADTDTDADTPAGDYTPLWQLGG